MKARPIEGEYTLLHPIEPEQGQSITKVIILRPKGKDRRVLDRYLTPEGGIRNPMGMQLEMIERLCRLPDGSDIFAGFADELDDEDVEALGKRVMPDSPNGQKTGATP